MMRAAILAILLLTLAVPGGAEIYRWVDGQGKVHFTTDLSQVPYSQRSGAEEGARQRRESDRVQRHSSSASPVAVSRRNAPTSRRWGEARKPTYTVAIPRGGTIMPVNVVLNDRVTAPFIIDTGASDVLIPRSVANQLGIRTDGDTMTKQYRTANGTIEAPVIRLNSVSLNGARVENVPASISDSMNHGLLGLSYFNHFQYEIDTANGVMHLTPNGMEESGGMLGGRSEAQWRSSFRNIRHRMERNQEELERTPSSRSRKIAQMEAQQEDLLRQLGILEADADQANVPFSWRQ